MKRFRFRLERVLAYRKVVTDERKRELLLKNMELQEAEEHLDYLEGEAAICRIRQDQVLSAEALHLIALYSQRLELEILEQKLQVLQCSEEVEQAMEAYVEASKDQKALETLKERRLDEYREEVLQAEGKFLDELSVQRGNNLYTEEEM